MTIMVRILKTTCLLFLFLALFDADDTFAAGRVFYDGFESGNMNLWDPVNDRNKCSVVSMPVDGSTGPRLGTKMAQCNWDGSVVWSDPRAHETQSINAVTNWAFSSEFLLRLWLRFDADQDSNDGAKMLRIGSFNNACGGDMSTMVILGDSTVWAMDSASGQGKTWYMKNVSADHQWHKVELYVFEHPTAGIARVWIDDVLEANDTNVDTTQCQGHDSWYFTFLSNWSLNPGWEHDGNNHTYWDEIEIFTDTGTGATGSMSAGTITQGGGDTTPPAAPTGFGVQ